MTGKREDEEAGRRADAAAERYLDLWERNQSDIAGRGPPLGPAPPPPAR